MNNGSLNPFGGIAAKLAAQSEAAIQTFDSDFEIDGILHCGNCETRKQVRISIGGMEMAVKCLCKCKTEERDRADAEDRCRMDEGRVRRLKSQGIHDKAILDWTFSNDDKRNPAMYARAMKYYTNWKKMLEDNIGILLWGNVGTGKTYFAACIANALLDCGVPVLMTNFTKIINALSGFHIDDKNEYIESLSRYSLLIVDDLGAERKSEFAHEIVFSVVDARYKSGKPMIITTNMTLDDMKMPDSITQSRIYDRILEMCVPVRFDGESKRCVEAKTKIEKARALLG